VIEGATKVDAYIVNNDEVKAYVEAREANFRKAKAFLENKGYEVDRSFFGSEDGEAILYRKRGTEDWHFLCHLDPLFVEIEDVEEYVKEAMEGMLSPEIREQVVGNVEIREVFKISKVGSIAGCMVLSGKVTRNSKVRLLRDGIVKYDGELESLKRYKDDVKEVTKGYECGLNLKGYNDIEVGDLLEIYEEVAIKKKLK